MNINMNFKNHPKTYEDVFSSDHKSNKNRIKIENVKVDCMDTEQYTLLFQNFMKEFYDDLFLKCAQLSWLRRKFTYAGQRAKMPVFASTRMFHGKFVKFIRRFVGHDIQIITKSFFFPKLENYYFDIMIPGFEEGNPFENPDYYTFPFKNISTEYLLLVYQLDDRLELLKEADKQKMSYAVFIDYVINHILTENEILGREKYSLSQGSEMNRSRPYFFVDRDKHFYPKKGDKRI